MVLPSSPAGPLAEFVPVDLKRGRGGVCRFEDLMHKGGLAPLKAHHHHHHVSVENIKGRGRLLVQVIVNESKGRHHDAASGQRRQRRHLPPFTVTLDPKQIDERQVAKLMELANYSPYAFTSRRRTGEWPFEPEMRSTDDTWQGITSPVVDERHVAAAHSGGVSETQRFPGVRESEISLQTAPSIDEGGFGSSGSSSSELPSLVSSLDASGSFQGLPLGKLRKAIDHSAVVVGFLVKRKALETDYMPDEDASTAESGRNLEGFFRIVPRGSSGNEMRLVAFARATSDASLTASIHDVIVHPDYQGSGQGRRIMQRLLRELQRFGIGDIALLCKPELCPYFARIGFASDQMRTTTMMYTREPWCKEYPKHDEGNERFVVWGSKLLAVSSDDLLSPAKKQALVNLLRSGEVNSEPLTSARKLPVKSQV